jgi:hypothetical protein
VDVQLLQPHQANALQTALKTRQGRGVSYAEFSHLHIEIKN